MMGRRTVVGLLSGSVLASLVKWWADQRPRYEHREGPFWVTDQNTRQAVELELRVRLGADLQQIVPEQTYCQRCQWPWLFTIAHEVYLRDHAGFFALCEKCWRETGPDERVRLTRAVYDQYWQHSETPWAEYEAAVREDRQMLQERR